MPNTSAAADSSLTGRSFRPAVSWTFWAAAPHGTCGAQITTVTPGFVRSASEAMPLGFPGPVTIVSVLVAKMTGLPGTRPASTALSMFFSSAEANTSAGAP